MERRFRERRKAMLGECEVTPEVFAGMMERLGEFAEPFIDSMWRREQKENARIYLSGLLSDVERKNVESIAYRHDRHRRAMQRFVGESSWEHKPLLEELARQAGQEIGEEDGVIVFDPSGFQKKGKESVGVTRQWLGRQGKVDNGQVAVYMGYASRKEHALVNERLYLPREWTKSRKRLRKCGVPMDIRFKTRHELALEMLEEQGKFLPHAWIAGDDEMGRSTAFRRGLRAREKQYLLGVPSNTGVRDLDATPPPYKGRGAKPKQPFQNVTRWHEALPKSVWTRVDVRDGEKGPLVVEVAKARVVARTERKRGAVTEELFVVIRVREDNGKMKYDHYLSNALPETPCEELARVAKAEHRVEDCIKRGKSEAGLADYEVRTWTGWHHHQTLSLIATWFLTQEAGRGKKMGACDHGTADSPGVGDVAA